MTLQSVDVINPGTNGDVVSLSMTMPGLPSGADSPFAIKGITGIGPVSADISASDYAAQDGALYQTSRIGKRNVVIQLELQPDYATNQTPRQMRKLLNNFLPPKGYVHLRFTDTVEDSLDLWGYVETNEPAYFTSNPTVQISIIAVDPFFLDLTQQVISGVSNITLALPYDGDAQAGFLFESTLTTSFENGFVLQDSSAGQLLRINTPLAFFGSTTWLAGDYIRVSTMPKNRFATVRRNGVTKNLLDQTVGTLDFQLGPKRKTLIFTDLSGTLPGQPNPRRNPFTVTYTPQYLGL